MLAFSAHSVRDSGLITVVDSVLARDGKSCDDSPSESSRCKQSKIKNKTFLIFFYDLDCGCELSPINDIDTIIIPELVGAGVQKEFDDFFVLDELKIVAWKKTYCDCNGETYRRDSRRFYRVETAKIYAK